MVRQYGDRVTLTEEPLHEIVELLRAQLGASGEAEVYALDPDLSPGRLGGERVEVAGTYYRHRSLQSWLDLAQRLACRLHTPTREGHLIRLRFSRLDASSWHSSKEAGHEAYGADTDFSRVQKLEEPTFLLDYTEALGRAGLRPGGRILSLGVGRGDELLPLVRLFPQLELSFTGIDHSESSLEGARARFPESRFVRADLNDLGALELGRFDLIISIATFQSPGVRGHDLIRELVQNHLSERGSLILALPNCRYQDGEVQFGAKMKNFSRPELSLVVRDLAFYRKYLQQHHFKVSITGKYYLFLSAVRAG